MEYHGSTTWKYNGVLRNSKDFYWDLYSSCTIPFKRILIGIVSNKTNPSKWIRLFAQKLVLHNALASSCLHEYSYLR